MKNETDEKAVESTGKEKKTEVWSITSLILGLVGLSMAPIPCGILAIIFGLKGRKETTRGMATAGFILGIADIVVGIILGFISLIMTVIYMANL